MTVSDILWLIFEIGINLFQSFSMIWFLDRILHRKSNFRLWGFVGCTLISTLCMCSYLFFPMPNNDLWIMAVPLVYALLFYRNTVMQKIFWVAITFLCISGVSYFMTWIMETVFHIDLEVLVSDSFARIVFVLTSNLLVFILYFIIPKAIKTRLEQPLPLALFVVIVLLLVFVGDAQFAIFDAKSEDANLLSQLSGAMILFITLLTVILYFILSNYAQEAAQKQLLETRIEQEKERVEELNQVSDSLHTLRHDLLNHLHIAYDLMQKGNPVESQQYLKNIESNIIQIFSTGCPALDSALYIKQQEMQQQGIFFQALITPIKALPITTYELCTLVTNLLDNAIEAAGRFPERPADYTVQFCIRRNGNMLFVECSNPVWEPSLSKDGERFLTSKPGKGHGLGISAIEKILDRMDAHGSFTAENGEFKAIIILPYLDEIEVDLPHDEAVKKHNAAIKAYSKTQTWQARLRRRMHLQ